MQILSITNIHLQGALSQVFRMKNVKDILPKLNFCIKRSMMQLDTYAKTGEVVRYKN